MVARGDLGLEMPLEQVPQVQKQVLRIGRDRGVPVIVATQVLESMRTESRPTRAEVSDAAGAVDAGADAIMLSGETAIGDYPVRAVEVLDAIIRNAEAVPPTWTLPAPATERPDHLPPLCDAAVTLAARAGADAIIAITRKGAPHGCSRRAGRPAPIYALTDIEAVARQLCLWWGVEHQLLPISTARATTMLVAACCRSGLRDDSGACRRRQRLSIVSGNPDLEPARCELRSPSASVRRLATSRRPVDDRVPEGLNRRRVVHQRSALEAIGGEDARCRTSSLRPSAHDLGHDLPGRRRHHQPVAAEPVREDEAAERRMFAEHRVVIRRHFVESGPALRRRCSVAKRRQPPDQGGKELGVPARHDPARSSRRAARPTW